MVLLIIMPYFANAQGAYVELDSLSRFGIKIIDNGDIVNSRLCQIKNYKTIEEYTPYEVKEYGLKDGRVYLSKEIQLSGSLKKVFLERLQNGKTNLFYYREKGIKTFYLERDSSLFLELPKHNKNEHYKELLLRFTKDFTNIACEIQHVKYNKRSLSKLINRYNNCVSKPFPHFRYGVNVGYKLTLLGISKDNSYEDLKSFDFNYEGSSTIGLFFDSPILISDFSIHGELNYSKLGYSYNTKLDDRDLDFVANLSSLNVPFLLRYSLPTNKIRPFVNLGGIVTFNVRNESLLNHISISGNIIEINKATDNSLIDDVQIGYSVGGGLEYIINSKRSLFFELRYNKQQGINDLTSIYTSDFGVSTGINF